MALCTRRHKLRRLANGSHRPLTDCSSRLRSARSPRQTGSTRFRIATRSATACRTRSPRCAKLRPKAAGRVVCTEEVEIHHSSDLAPYIEGAPVGRRRYPGHGADGGRRSPARFARGHSSWHTAAPTATNLYSRTPPLGPRSMGSIGGTGASPSRRARMDKRTSATIRALAPAGGAAREACRLRHRLRLCRPWHVIWPCISCSAAATSAPTNMAARWKTALGCCANCSRTPRTPSATPALWRCVGRR